ncbi:MAG: flagellar export chaperone FliS [Sedimentisphaerales bacterium]|nr:flagellar export chaperone FliS [Sedimentisphaerales bacterium]
MNGVDIYQQTTISTQNKGRLIVMLYDGAIRFLRQAIRDMEANDYAAKGHSIAKAQDVILELNTVLDMESGGEIAQNLRSLYNFMLRHLSQANLKCEPQMVREVISLLEDLNQSWRAITG